MVGQIDLYESRVTVYRGVVRESGSGSWRVESLLYCYIIGRFNSLPWSQTDPELVNSYLIVQYFLHPDRVVVVVQVEDFSASKFGCY